MKKNQRILKESAQFWRKKKRTNLLIHLQNHLFKKKLINNLRFFLVSWNCVSNQILWGLWINAYKKRNHTKSSPIMSKWMFTFFFLNKKIYGQLAVCSLSSCSVSPYFRAIRAWISSSRSSKCWARRRANKYAKWIRTIRSPSFRRYVPTRGTRCFVRALRLRPFIWPASCSSIRRRRASLRWRHVRTPSSTNCASPTISCPTDANYRPCSILLLTVLRIFIFIFTCLGTLKVGLSRKLFFFIK